MRQLAIGYALSDRSEAAGLLNIADAIKDAGGAAVNMDWTQYRFPMDVKGVDRPDIFLAYGDRREQLIAASIMHALEVPIAHVHGGEYTLGSLDNRSRWALSAMASVSFAATKQAEAGLCGLNDLTWHRNTVCWTGAPSLDDIEPTAGETHPFILCTLHPSQDRDGRPETYTHVFQALAKFGAHVVFTAPNREPGRDFIENHIQHYVENRDAEYIPCMGVEKYREHMSRCMMMVGNSSSGIIEAPSFGCPVINIGDRQHLRVGGDNVVWATPSYPEILRLMRTPPPRKLYDNPYRKNGRAAQEIARVLCAK
jgi:UDP-hydrolysing UDP-N-acetyl-D-glucosamine 2-epimerase